MTNATVNATTNLALPVSIATAALQKFEDRSPEYLGGIASYMLQSLAEGGMLLSAYQVSRIQKAADTRDMGVCDSDDVVDLAEEACDRSGDTLVVPVRIDPAYEPALKELGRTQGRTPEEIVQDLVAWVMDQGWAYEWHPEPRKLLLAEEDWADMKAIFGEDVTGTDMANWIRERATAPEPPAPAGSEPETFAILESTEKGRDDYLAKQEKE